MQAISDITKNFTTISADLSLSGTEIAVGSLYLALSIHWLVLHLATLSVIMSEKAERKFAYYKIIISICFADIVQIFVAGFIAGVFTLFHSAAFWVQKFFGALMMACWYANCFDLHLLAINQFFSVCFSSFAKQAFSKTKTYIYISRLWLVVYFWLC